MDILKVEKLTDEKWLNLFATTFQHGDHNGRWVFASRKPGDDPYKIRERCDAVLIVAILHEAGRPPRLVLEKEFRVPVGDYTSACRRDCLILARALSRPCAENCLKKPASP